MRLLVWTWSMLEIMAAQAQPAAPPAIPAEAHVRQAAAYRKKGDSQRAIAELRHALSLKPDLRDAQGMLGEILLEQGFAEEAVPHLERTGHFQSLAVALMELNRLPQTMHQLLPLYRQRPGDPEQSFHLGEASGNLMQEAFDRLIRTYPDSPRARELRARNGPGRTRAGLAEPEKLDALLTAYVQHPDDVEALF